MCPVGGAMLHTEFCRGYFSIPQRVSQAVDVPQSRVNVRRCANGFGAPNRLRSGIAAMSPALTAIPCSSSARATPIGERPSMTKVNTGTRLSALRGPMSRSRGIRPVVRGRAHQCLIMSRPGLVPSLFEEADGGRKTNRPCDVGSSCLELLRAVLEFSTVELNSVSHIAADVVRRHESSSSRRPQRTPVAIGPSILCPEKM